MVSTKVPSDESTQESTSNPEPVPDDNQDEITENQPDEKIQKSLYLHPRKSKQLKMLSAMMDRPQSDLAEEAITKYIESQAPSLKKMDE